MPRPPLFCLLALSILAAPVAASSFSTVAEIPIPGPVQPMGPRLIGSEVLCPVAEGIAVAPATGTRSADVRAGTLPELPPLEERWNLSPDGRMRARSVGGFLEVQKKCRRCRRGWKRKWRARLPATALASPVIGTAHVFVGTMDNHVYALRRRNGHRVWVADLGRRVMRPLLWLPEAALPEAVLVIPGAGERLLALNSKNGERLAEFTPGDGGGTLVGGAVATPDGEIVVARQQYDRSKAALVVLRLGGGLTAEEKPEPVAYNEPSAQPAKDEAPAPERPPPPRGPQLSELR